MMELARELSDAVSTFATCQAGKVGAIRAQWQKGLFLIRHSVFLTGCNTAHTYNTLTGRRSFRLGTNALGMCVCIYLLRPGGGLDICVDSVCVCVETGLLGSCWFAKKCVCMYVYVCLGCDCYSGVYYAPLYRSFGDAVGMVIGCLVFTTCGSMCAGFLAEIYIEETWLWRQRGDGQLFTAITFLMYDLMVRMDCVGGGKE